MLLYNSFTQQKETVSFIDDNSVKLYVCGITPYDTTHLGHAFLYVFFDAYIRYLRFSGKEVIYTQNVTDIDNDILKRAKEEGRDWQELGQWWTDKFLTDLKNLNVEMPTHYVKATGSIDKIIEMTKGLIQKGHAYEKDGWVYFSVETFPEYGKLSHFTEKQMLLLAKERGGDPNDTRKKAPMDFVLWQPSAVGEPGWESPLGLPAGRQGKGRPGWHIECSAMSNEFLGEQIDIHGGGRDLIFPHHESEIAQSESFTGKSPFVRYWMHAAMVMYQGEKMSKSLGNLVLVSDLLKIHSANAIRYTLLSHHYRTPWEFHEEELSESQEKLNTIQEALTMHASTTEDSNETESVLSNFAESIENDADIPKALEIMLSLAKKFTSGESIASEQKALQTMFTTLGFTL